MEGNDGELLAAQGKTPTIADVVLALRRVIYRCELLQQAEFSDGNRQALWEAVVVSYYGCFTSGVLTAQHLRRLNPVHAQTHELLARERARHAIGEPTVIPNGICPLDLEAGALAEPYVDPTAARSLAEELIEVLGPSR